MIYLSITLILIGVISYLIRIKRYETNRYIDRHKKYIKDDSDYNAYLDWCLENEEIPMNEVGFEDIRSKISEIEKAIR